MYRGDDYAAIDADEFTHETEHDHIEDAIHRNNIEPIDLVGEEA